MALSMRKQKGAKGRRRQKWREKNSKDSSQESVDQKIKYKKFAG